MMMSRRMVVAAAALSLVICACWIVVGVDAAEKGGCFVRGDNKERRLRSNRAASSGLKQGKLAALRQANLCSQDSSRFNICFDYSPDASPIIQTVAERAGKRWMEIITEDLETVTFSVNVSSTINRVCGYRTNLAPRVFDDLSICVNVGTIDGPGGTLGVGFPFWVRPGSDIPFLATMAFDIDDVPESSGDDLFGGIVLHEIGHALGLARDLWFRKQLIPSASNPQCNDYRGTNANREYQRLSGCLNGSVPIASNENRGSNCAHWDESCFRTELMTGFVAFDMPISRLTVAGLEDIGYTVDYGAADEYGSENLGSSCVCNNNHDNSSRTRRNPESDRPHRRRRLSDEGRAAAEKYGRQILQERLKDANIDGVGVIESLVVLFEEKNEVHSVYVTMNDDDIP